MSPRAIVPALVVAVVCAASPARAADDSASQEKAEQLYAQGEEAYAAGDAARALKAFGSAYDLVGVPALLLNIGQCHKMLGHHAEAASFFERYLKDETEAVANREDIVELIRDERALADADAAAAAAAATTAAAAPPGPVAATPAASAEAPLYEQPAFWGVAGGVALAALVGGAVIAVVASTPPPTGSLGRFDLRAPQ